MPHRKMAPRSWRISLGRSKYMENGQQVATLICFGPYKSHQSPHMQPSQNLAVSQEAQITLPQLAWESKLIPWVLHPQHEQFQISRNDWSIVNKCTLSLKELAPSRFVQYGTTHLRMKGGCLCFYAVAQTGQFYHESTFCSEWSRFVLKRDNLILRSSWDRMAKVNLKIVRNTNMKVV